MYKVTLESEMNLKADMLVSYWGFKKWAQEWFDVACENQYTVKCTLEKKRWLRDEWDIVGEYDRGSLTHGA